MYTPLIDRQNVLARQNEILQAARRYRQTKKSDEPHSAHWLKLRNLFSGRKMKKQTAVIPQAQ